MGSVVAMGQSANNDGGHTGRLDGQWYLAKDDDSDDHGGGREESHEQRRASPTQNFLVRPGRLYLLGYEPDQ